MKTLEQIILQYETRTIDGRDLNRLADFLTVEQIEKLGMSFNTQEGRDSHVAKEFTREAVLAQLKEDVAFGFTKALNRRGISAGCMFEVVMMWNWVLEEGLEDFDSNNNYAQYGLPLFKATAVKYGFENPIGDDTGSEEHKYSSEAPWGDE